MGTISRGTKAGGGTNFNSGQIIDPAEVNTDLNTVFAEANGALDDANIETGTIPGAKSLRFTAMSAPSSPSSGDVLAFVVATDTLTWKQSGGFTHTLKVGEASINEKLAGPFLQASDTTERSTNSGASADLSTLTVNIPAGDAFVVTGSVRRNAGAAAASSLGLKLNSTQIIANFAVTTGVGAVEYGTFSFGIDGTVFGSGRDTNYTQAGGFVAKTGASGSVTVYSSNTYAAQIPTAAITSVIITGNSGSASTTLFIKNVAVYRIVRS